MIKLPGDLLPDALPLTGARLHLLGIHDDLPHRQVLRHARAALANGQGFGISVFVLRCGCVRKLSIRLRIGDLFQTFEQQLQLRRIELLAAPAKHAPRECIELLAQQLVLKPGGVQSLTRRAQSLVLLTKLLHKHGVSRTTHGAALDACIRASRQFFFTST